jgi:GntR family transcriptional repressor for pyruvate dehydrogenase complex
MSYDNHMSSPDHVPLATSSRHATRGLAATRPSVTVMPLGNAALLTPLRQNRSLSSELVDRLTRDILDGTLTPGAQLPTEQQLGAALGVSRTVVREAMAALKGDGLVIARQGAGVYVAEHDQRRPFRIDPKALTSLDNVLDLMELRTGLESEAAALAAQRRTAADVQNLDRALAAIDEALRTGSDAAQADFAFHRAIMVATHNAYFVDFLRYLGQFITPRQSVRAMAVPPAGRAVYLRRVQVEHRLIRNAIADRNETAARKAAQQHLRNSRKRYGKLRDTNRGVQPAP